MSVSIQSLKQILNSVSAYTVIFRENEIVTANQSALEWLTIGERELKSSSLSDYIHQNSMAQAFDAYKNLADGVEHDSLVRLCIKHPSGRNAWIDVTIKAIDYLSDDQYWMATFTASRTVPTEGLVPSPVHQTETLVGEDHIEQHALLTDVVTGNRFIDTALEDFLTTLQDIVPYDSASITLVENHQTRFIATRGLPESMLNVSSSIPPDHITYKSGEILYENENGKVVYIADTMEHPHWISIDGITHVRSWIGVELKYDNQLLGILNIDSSQPHFFTRDDARHALALSQQAILAIVYTRLYQQFYYDMEERTRLQQILVQNLITTETMYASQELLFSSENLADTLPELIELVCSALNQTRIIMVSFNLATEALAYKLQSIPAIDPLWKTFCEVIEQEDLPDGAIPATDVRFRTGETITLGDGRLAIAAPINRRGALIAIREPQYDAFNETDHELIVTIAKQITIAQENEILYAQLRQHTQNLERVVEKRTSQLSIERKRLRAILDSTAEGIFYMEDFELQYANPAFCRMVGYTLEELYQKPLSFIRVTQEHNEMHNFSTLLNKPMEVEPGRSETRLRHQDGTEFYASIRFSLVGQPGENPVRMVAIARDISQERKLFFQRARFIANVGHELRTPLSSLVLRLHMLRRQPERLQEHISSLDSVTQYLRELVEELLTLSRFERGSITLDKNDYVLQDIIRQAATEQEPFAAEQGVRLELNLPDAPATATVDGKRIHQMISNLMVNGINYSSQDDLVLIDMTVETDMLGNKNAVIHVRDEGEGIEPELLPDDIFEPFSRPSGGSRKETGMGLALVREIVTLHGGSVHVRSKLGEGSTFRLILPLD